MVPERWIPRPVLIPALLEFIPYPMNWPATGNPAQPVSRTIYVIDLTPPALTLTGGAIVRIEAGTDYLTVGAMWTDADGNGTLLARGEVKSLVPGLYVLRYDYTDEAGNQSETVTRTVVVKDTTPPVISLNGSAEVTIEAGTEYQDEGASWSDLVDGTGTVDAKWNSQAPGTEFTA